MVSPGKQSALSALGIKAPVTPQLKPWLQAGPSKKHGEYKKLVK